MKQIATMVLLLVVMLTGVQCNTLKKVESEAYPIGYMELQNYFVLNTVDHKKPLRLVIDDQATFDRYFGAAAVMGRNGQPTRVNFGKQFVLAVVLPETNRATVVIPGEISQIDNTVVFNYIVRKGEKQSHKVVPFAAVAIDKPESTAQFEFYFKQTN